MRVGFWKSVQRTGLACLAGLWTQAAWAQQTPPPAGTVSGRVLTAAGAPAVDAQVQLVDLRRRMAVDETGAFRFADVPAGEYILQAESPRYGLSVTRVQVLAGQEARLEMTLDLAQHQETIVVTAQAEARTLNELAQPVTVLAGTELALRLKPTLGETLAEQPGVNSTYFGPGASRPVIRGLGGDRIRVLQGGLGTADASNISPDHAVSYDPLSARQIEVLRGPATLLYGSNAVGGVVNVIDTRIPDLLPDHPVTGAAELAGGSAADERAGSLSLDGGLGHLAWHGDFFKRKTDDVNIPGFAESAALRAEEAAEGEEHAEEVQGVLENSAIDSQGGSAGVSLIGGRGLFGISLSGFDTLYGVPGHAHTEGEGGEEGRVQIDLRQRRADLRGELHNPLPGFRAARLRFGVADYQHQELEGGAVGTRFDNESWEGRLELPHRPAGPLTGSLGVQVSSRDFASVGEESVVPPTDTSSWAVFAFEEVGRSAWRLQLGGRYESQDVDARGEEPARRSFSGLSASGGIVWHGAQGWSAGLTVARSVKMPTAEELFSNGPHLATRAFEIGDPDLGKEKSLGIDLSLRKRTGRLTGELHLFANRFDDYIYEELTGEEEDGLTVARFVQRDAEFLGAEVGARVELFHDEPHHLDLELSADLVRAELRDSGQPLPRIPPARLGAALHYASQHLSGRVEVRGVTEQDRVASLERPTDGYTFLNTSLGYRIFAGRTILDLMLRGTNLADAEGRNHVSFLKDMVPLPGRDVRLSLRVTF